MSAPRTTPVWRLVAEREITSKLRDKAFLGGVAFTLALLIAVFIATAFIGGGEDEFKVAVTDPGAAKIVDQGQQVLKAGDDDKSTITATSYDSVSVAQQAVRADDVDAALVKTDSGYQVVGNDKVDDKLKASLTAAVSGTAVADNAAKQDVDLDALNAGTRLDQKLLDPDAAQSDARSAVAFGFAIVFFVTALGFGMTISQSVVQEKESRVVEILAAAAPIRSMLWGKILGNTALALGQVVLIVIVGVVGLIATGRRELLAGVGPAVIWYVAFFVLGFVALARLWSVAGSLATRQEDLQSTTLPGQVILMVPYLLSVLAGDEVRTICSMLPIVSTMTMPGRMAEGDVPFWQVGVAVAVTVLAAIVFVRIGTRLYERTLLQTGRKMGYREAFATSGE